MTVIELDNLSKEFDGYVALDGIDLEVPSGSVYGVVGPNGSGKSTLINILAGLVSPSGGEARVFGLDVEKHSDEINERTGVVHGDFGLYNRLTGREHVEFMARSSDSDMGADEALSLVGLESVCDRVVSGYSGGMVKRLGIAMALISDPDLLLLDEPFRALDIESSRIIEDIVSNLSQEGRTVVFSTHQFDYVERLCDAACILKDGSLLLADSINDICGDEGRLDIGFEDGSIDDIVAYKSIEGITDVSRNDRRVVVRGSLDGCVEILNAINDSGSKVNVQFSYPSLTNVAEDNAGGVEI